jgi:hypothetical protein
MTTFPAPTGIPAPVLTVHATVGERARIAADEAAEMIVSLTGWNNHVEIRAAYTMALIMLRAFMDIEDTPADEVLNEAIDLMMDRWPTADVPTAPYRRRNLARALADAS